MNEKETRPQVRKLTRAEQAFIETLFREHQEDVLKVLRRNLQFYCYSVIDDAMQEVYKRACAHIKTVIAHEHPEAWLMNAAFKVSMEMIRDVGRYDRLPEECAAPPADHRGLKDILPESTPEKDRDILNRYYVRRDSSVEIGKDLNMPDNTVRQQIKRAKDALRKKLNFS